MNNRAALAERLKVSFKKLGRRISSYTARSSRRELLMSESLKELMQYYEVMYPAFQKGASSSVSDILP
jgi:hypothetical protein